MSNICPVCKKEFRRKIEKWMKFTCSDCNKDLCKETDVVLYSGICKDCTWKKFDFPNKNNVKVINVPLEKNIKKQEIRPPVKHTVDDWLK